MRGVTFADVQFLKRKSGSALRPLLPVGHLLITSYIGPRKLEILPSNSTFIETMDDDGVCIAPDGSPMWTFGLSYRARVLWILMIVASTPITMILLGPMIIRKIGSLFGLYLKKKTAGRKALIQETVETEEKEFKEAGEERRESDEWESVEAYAVGTSKNGEKADKEWDGIVGFFHPFW
jgi:hypothetical protein